MVECMFESECLNAGSWKCSLCLHIAEVSKRNEGYSHYPAFKDKTVYAKHIPYIRLESLFNIHHCEVYRKKSFTMVNCIAINKKGDVNGFA
jgi:3-dehydroquinate dehydratase